MFSKLFKSKDNPPAQPASQEQPKSQEPLPEFSAPAENYHLPQQEFGLTFTFEDGKSQTFTALPITIGRSSQNNLIVQDPSISAQHAYVYYDERLQNVCITDLDSTNGLFINDRPTRRNLLQDNARIQLGNLILTFHDTGYIHST